jgi:GT2 family glycosyltransferase
MALSPIALFTYNRPDHTRKTVEALQQNKLSGQSDLFIFSDGPKDGVSENQVNEVRNYLKTIRHFKSINIIERESNIGLSSNIMEGVHQIVSSYGKIIVLEDDLLTSPYFLDFMNDSLNLYEEDNKVISIHGYIYPVLEKLPETFSCVELIAGVGQPGNGVGSFRTGWPAIAQKLGNQNKQKNLISTTATRIRRC